MEQISQSELKRVKDNLFFVVGPSRSGTTLLQVMLSSNQRVTIPPETHFFHHLPRLKRHFGEHLDEKAKWQLINYWQDYDSRMRDLGLSKILIKDAVAHCSPASLEELFITYLTLYGKQRGKSVIGEKTPRHIMHVDSILKAFPNAKIIALFRDPRATALSEMKAAFGSPSVYVTARRWARYAARHRSYAQNLPDDQYMMIRYEDLISEPEAMLKSISSFLQIPFEEQMLKYYERSGREKGFPDHEHWKAGTDRPIQKDRNQRWREELDPQEIELIQNKAGAYMQEMGYELTENECSELQLGTYRICDYARSIFSTITGARKQGYREPGYFRL